MPQCTPTQYNNKGKKKKGREGGRERGRNGEKEREKKKRSKEVEAEIVSFFLLAVLGPLPLEPHL
jgi:hypothetical protein